MSPSPFQENFFNGHTFYLKRDDLLDPNFSGNKARKFYYFLVNDFPHINRVVSYGSNQSNAMYSLSVLCAMKGWEFIYFCDHIPAFLRENPVGNFHYALQNGMKLRTSSAKKEEALACVDEQTLFVEEGGRQEEAELGIHYLANELMVDIQEAHIKNPFIFLPSGTGTTALFLQKHLPYPVFTCNTVGNSVYLQKQWEMLPSQTCYPEILEASQKYHYGKLYPELYLLWEKLKEEMGVEFDLVYDPVGWSVLLEHIEHLAGTPIYIHQGGLLGNVSMLKRYQYKYDIIKP
jgi:1-aminocyclopropane-1-carboxylate deaminase/D-cysteine desulfhydrase-like pyridoxal-dependent ACC family enzyme